MLIYHEQPEQIAHGRSFLMSNLSDLLTVALLIWATWAIFSQSLICLERANQSKLLIWFEQNEQMSEWANFQPWLQLQNPKYNFLAKVPKIFAQRHRKYQIRKQHYTISYKSCESFAENYLMNLISPKIGTFLSFRRSKYNSHLAKRTSFSYINPFDSCLIMKKWNPRKWHTLIYTCW